jgi:hypothetical protein
MRGNLDFFLQRQSLESNPQKAVRLDGASPDMVEYLNG